MEEIINHELIQLRCRKSIVAYKLDTTSAGERAALSHTASLSSDKDIIDAAFEEAGIIRIRNYGDLVAVAKVFELPAMRGNRIMVMSPAGGYRRLCRCHCPPAMAACRVP